MQIREIILGVVENEHTAMRIFFPNLESRPSFFPLLVLYILPILYQLICTFPNDSNY